MIVATISYLIQKNDKEKLITNVLTPTYVVFIVMVTLLNRADGGGYNLIPFWSYMAAYGGALYLWKEVALNYLLFMPLGFFLMIRMENTVKVSMIDLCFSSLIEIAQLMFNRGLFEFDDIIGNTIGCLIGAMIGKIVCRYLISKRQS